MAVDRGLYPTQNPESTKEAATILRSEDAKCEGERREGERGEDGRGEEGTRKKWVVNGGR